MPTRKDGFLTNQTSELYSKEQEKGFFSKTQRGLSMEVKSREKDKILIYDLKGEFVRSDDAAAAIQNRVKDRLESGQKNFIFNFEKVEFIDSFGVGELVACYISIARMGGQLKILNIPPKIRALFKITVLDRVFEIYEEEETAIRSFVE